MRGAGVRKGAQAPLLAPLSLDHSGAVPGRLALRVAKLDPTRVATGAPPVFFARRAC
jgi:hypothetical protein